MCWLDPDTISLIILCNRLVKFKESRRIKARTRFDMSWSRYIIQSEDPKIPKFKCEWCLKMRYYITSNGQGNTQNSYNVEMAPTSSSLCYNGSDVSSMYSSWRKVGLVTLALAAKLIEKKKNSPELLPAEADNWCLSGLASHAQIQDPNSLNYIIIP